MKNRLFGWIWRWSLAPVLEAVYAAGLTVVYALYRVRILRRHRLPVKVVSVGNLTWGGTGKTPLVLFLARQLKKQGWRVAVLTRGYGKDEAQLLTDKLAPIPVLVGPDRLANGKKAIEQHNANLVLLDDGYQQWRLIKDIEILMVNEGAPWGNGRLIPRGILREPIRAGRGAELVVMKQSIPDPAAAIWTEVHLRAALIDAPLFQMGYTVAALRQWPGGALLPPSSLKGQRVATLAGIAGPDQFEATVRSLGASVPVHFRARDHHPYTAQELVRMVQRCQRNQIDRLVTTAKDAVRFRGFFIDLLKERAPQFKILIVEIEPWFKPDESQLLHRIDTLLAR